MKIINTAKTDTTNSYYYSSVSKRFGQLGDYANHGFNADIMVIVDADLAAQELDAIFSNVLFKGV